VEKKYAGSVIKKKNSTKKKRWDRRKCSFKRKAFVLSQKKGIPSRKGDERFFFAKEREVGLNGHAKEEGGGGPPRTRKERKKKKRENGLPGSTKGGDVDNWKGGRGLYFRFRGKGKKKGVGSLPPVL